MSRTVRSPVHRAVVRSTTTELALWVGASLTAALGGYLLATALTPVSNAAPVLPPYPLFGTEKPEVMNAIGPYGVTLATPGTGA